MANLVEQAKKGRREAMHALTQATGDKTLRVCRLLLGDEKAAAQATVEAYRKLWDALPDADVADEAAFARRAISDAAELCRREALKRDAKAFRQPQGRNFALPAPAAPVDLTRDDGLDALLDALPTLHRFFLVLHTAADFSQAQLAAFFRWDEKTVSLALAAEPANLTKLLSDGVDLREVYDRLRADKADDVPAAVKSGLISGADDAAAPHTRAAKRRVAIIVAAVVVLCLLGGGLALLLRPAAPGDTTSDTASGTSSVSSADASLITEPVVALDAEKTYYADIDIQDYGTVTVRLDPTAAPVTVSNFIHLAQEKFYDGLTFHRIMEGFMMQGGDPDGNGSGGADRCIVGEFADNGRENNLSHKRGVISMARAEGNDTASSQFFIVQQDSTYLDGAYAAFGTVTAGMEVVDAVCKDAKPTDDNGTIPAAEQPVIRSIVIRTE